MKPDSLPLMIFAAGFGTRMGALTEHLPKPLLKVGGQTLIDRALAIGDAAGTTPVVVNTHYLADKVAMHLSGRPVHLSREHPDILDTGGGLKQALPILGSGPVATLNPDVIWQGPNPLRFLAERWDGARMDALLLCVPLVQTIGRLDKGDFGLSDDGSVRRGGDLVYGGAQILDPEVVRMEPARVFSLNRVWDRVSENRRLHVALYPGRWCDVGHPEGIDLAERLIEDSV